MKKLKIILLSVFFFTFGAALQAQEWSPALYQVGKKYPGYIIKLNGDTVNGFIEANDRCAVGGFGNSNQNRCEFYLNEKDKKAEGKYGPKEILGYMIADKFYKSIPYSGGLFKKNNFCLMTKAGRITTYEWYSTKDGFSTMRKKDNETQKEYDARRYETDIVFMHEEGTEVVSWTAMVMGFAKKMSKMTADYPALSKKVKNKESGYKVMNILEVLEEYNKYFEEGGTPGSAGDSDDDDDGDDEDDEK